MEHAVRIPGIVRQGAAPARDLLDARADRLDAEIKLLRLKDSAKGGK